MIVETFIPAGKYALRARIKCDWCDTEFVRRVSKLHNHHFCSHKCHGLWLRENYEPTQEWREKMSEIQKSKTGLNKWRREHLKNIQKLQIGKSYEELYGNEKSRELRDLHRQLWTGENNPAYGGLYGKLNPNWKGGISFEPYSSEFNSICKEKIRKRDHYACQICGITQEAHMEKYNKKLSIHHIDYDKENSAPENLITLCFRCNSRANRDRKYWQKHFNEHIAYIEQPQYYVDDKIGLDDDASPNLPRGGSRTVS